MKYFIVITVLLLPGQLFAACERIEKNSGLDGPGTLSPLQGTLTLDCLKIVSITQASDIFTAVVEDEKGKNYKIKVGSFIGEKSGRVKEIKSDEIIIEQLELQNGKWLKKYVSFKKRKK